MKEILLFLFAIIFVSCHSAAHYYNKGNYEKAISKSINSAHKNPHKLKSLENILLNSVLNLNNSDLFKLNELSNESVATFEAQQKFINKIDKRQTKIKELYNELNREFDKEKYRWIDCNEMQNQVDRRAISFYNNKLSQLNDSIFSGKKHYASNALNVLDTLLLYGKNNYDFGDSYLSLINNGSTYFKVNLINTSDEYTYDNFLTETKLHKANSIFQLFTFEDHDDIDHEVLIEILEIDPGYESTSSSTRCHSREVIDRYENRIVKVEIPQPPIKKIVKMWCDSVWVEKEVWESVPPIIKEETKSEPVYITVHATETITEISKQATAKIRISFLDLDTKDVLFEPSYSYSDEMTTISGDDRAFTFIPFCGHKILSTPSDDTMIESLKDEVSREIIYKLKQHTKKIIASN